MQNQIIIFSGFNQRAVISFIRTLEKNNVKYVIVAASKTDTILNTVYKDKVALPTTYNRLLRRIVRDFQFRNYSAKETIARWASVRRGEDIWISPFQEEADAMFNSAMIYEFAALGRSAEPILSQVSPIDSEYSEAYRLLKFLNYFKYIDIEELPNTSLLREFLGGSSFRY